MIIFVTSIFNFYINTNFSNFIATTKNLALMLIHSLQTSINNVFWSLIVISAYTFVINTTACHIYRVWLCFSVFFYFSDYISKAETGCAKLFCFTFAFSGDKNCGTPLVLSYLFFSKMIFIYEPTKKRF